MKLLFFNSYHNATNGIDISRKFNGIYRHCPKVWQSNQMKLIDEIAERDLVLIWNPLEPCTHWVKQICKKLNKPWLSLENGFVPQKDYYHLDHEGIIHESSLNNNLDWLTEEKRAYAEEHIDRFFTHKGWSYSGGDYILCPLQLPWDTSIYLSSNFKTMDDFITRVIETYPNDKIIATPHPLNNPWNKKSKCISDKIKSKIHLDLDHSTLRLAQKAKSVIGITSTVLYETIALGAPTQAWGDCPINKHSSHRDVVLAAINKQFHKHDFDRFEFLVNELLSNYR